MTNELTERALGKERRMCLHVMIDCAFELRAIDQEAVCQRGYAHVSEAAHEPRCQCGVQAGRWVRVSFRCRGGFAHDEQPYPLDYGMESERRWPVMLSAVNFTDEIRVPDDPAIVG